MKPDSSLFIEYFIIGGLAIIWLLPLAYFIDIDPQNLTINTTTTLVSIPIIYILGMLLDYLAAILFSYRKRKVRCHIFNQNQMKMMRYHEVLNAVCNSKNELTLKHIERRNSRVRYSRGALLNFIIASFIVPLIYFLMDDSFNWAISLIFLTSITLISWQMWEKMLNLSYSYQTAVLKGIKPS